MKIIRKKEGVRKYGGYLGANSLEKLKGNLVLNWIIHIDLHEHYSAAVFAEISSLKMC